MFQTAFDGHDHGGHGKDGCEAVQNGVGILHFCQNKGVKDYPKSRKDKGNDPLFMGQGPLFDLMGGGKVFPPEKDSGKHHGEVPEKIEHHLPIEGGFIRDETVGKGIDDPEKVAEDPALSGKNGIEGPGNCGKDADKGILHINAQSRNGYGAENGPDILPDCPGGKFPSQPGKKLFHSVRSF